MYMDTTLDSPKTPEETKDVKTCIFAYGAYSVILRPPPFPANKKYQNCNYVMKYGFYSRLEEEFRIARILKRFDPNGHYFCTAEIGTLSESGIQIQEVEKKAT